MPDDWDQLTLLLNDLPGDGDVQNRVFAMVYGELRSIARKLVSQESAAEVQATELLHEAYLKKLRRLRVPIRNRQHFYSLATRAMRQVLIEDARRRHADKRQLRHVSYAEWLSVAGAGWHDPDRLLEIEPFLKKLKDIDPRAASVVDLRFFLGCSLEETADVLGATLRSVRDDWDFARLWLQKQLGGGKA